VEARGIRTYGERKREEKEIGGSIPETREKKVRQVVMALPKTSEEYGARGILNIQYNSADLNDDGMYGEMTFLAETGDIIIRQEGLTNVKTTTKLSPECRKRLGFSPKMKIFAATLPEDFKTSTIIAVTYSGGKDRQVTIKFYEPDPNWQEGKEEEKDEVKKGTPALFIEGPMDGEVLNVLNTDDVEVRVDKDKFTYKATKLNLPSKGLYFIIFKAWGFGPVTSAERKIALDKLTKIPGAGQKRSAFQKMHDGIASKASKALQKAAKKSLNEKEKVTVVIVNPGQKAFPFDCKRAVSGSIEVWRYGKRAAGFHWAQQPSDNIIKWLGPVLHAGETLHVRYIPKKMAKKGPKIKVAVPDGYESYEYKTTWAPNNYISVGPIKNVISKGMMLFVDGLGKQRNSYWKASWNPDGTTLIGLNFLGVGPSEGSEITLIYKLKKPTKKPTISPYVGYKLVDVPISTKGQTVLDIESVHVDKNKEPFLFVNGILQDKSKDWHPTWSGANQNLCTAVVWKGSFDLEPVDVVQLHYAPHGSHTATLVLEIWKFGQATFEISPPLTADCNAAVKLFLNGDLLDYGSDWHPGWANGKLGRIHFHGGFDLVTADHLELEYKISTGSSMAEGVQKAAKNAVVQIKNIKGPNTQIKESKPKSKTKQKKHSRFPKPGQRKFGV